jgi:hypothetical protein
MNAQDAPLVFDVLMGTNPKAVWAEGGKFYCRCGTGKVQVEMQQPGVYRTIPGTFESAPKPKVMADWRRRALARMQS